jgi:hypothetical protein
VLAGPLGLAACVEDPPAEPPPTTVQEPEPEDPGPLFEAAAGCYGFPGLFDVAFTGQVDVFGNAPMLRSTDGSCSGRPMSAPWNTNTIVSATTYDEARALCSELDPAHGSYLPARVVATGWRPTFPIYDAWTCVY